MARIFLKNAKGVKKAKDNRNLKKKWMSRTVLQSMKKVAETCRITIGHFSLCKLVRFHSLIPVNIRGKAVGRNTQIAMSFVLPIKSHRLTEGLSARGVIALMIEP